MRLYKITFLFLFALCIISCGKNEQRDEPKPKKNTETQSGDTRQEAAADSIKAIKESILRNKNYKRKKDNISNAPTTNKTLKVEETDKVAQKTATANKANTSFVYIKKILNDCKTGETLTQKELSTNYNIPVEAIKLVKSITKISPDEIDVKWKSTWWIEKVSDAKFKDGRLKVHFNKNRMYTSGDAIAIKYNKKLYTDLIITGRIARIPEVKDFCWQIGK